ncbi:biotin--[acetyl-CoA-carboxylase] ligase [Epilithonimonas hungarica]|uniref:BirA family transcriptional regulator, biotin operon repressor / biotin-[acetyl-CoA-carboxylase] ligase n=1 Tax=Epilithonimonas hungarica TaxID=454006 RepID=A0A1G7FJR8_9FLAO|nr:biotin--[acetyl-CoA-carboxylase] ligase [Epilithonimonas hungarica]SDE76163.1 BirA family transcriptional regulator, biotin operon repressor / biotin-[acetyl-CoA-carboxylase] ligase [Epilithonimonas hungarica]
MSHLIHLKECFSTNDEISSLLYDDESTAVFTFNQIKGRGQYGNIWKVMPNENLAYSLAIKTSKVNISDISLNYYTAIIVRDFLDNLTKETTKIKWPNDIILNGKKVCGILIEKKKINNDEFYIIGIGINVLQTDFTNLPKAGSIYSVTGININLLKFVEKFHQNIIARLNQVLPEESILTEYNSNLFRKEEITVFQKNELRQHGIIKNADKSGFLWIDLEDEGLQKFFHKEIEILY